MKKKLYLICLLCMAVCGSYAQKYDEGAVAFLKNVYTDILTSNSVDLNQYMTEACCDKINRLNKERHCFVFYDNYDRTPTDLVTLKVIPRGKDWYSVYFISDLNTERERQHDIRYQVKKEKTSYMVTDIDEDNGIDTTLTADNVVLVPEQLPEFPGGNQELANCMSKSVYYPAYAKANGLAGRVIVTFVVRKDGKVCNEKVYRGVCPCLDNAALFAIRHMPNFKPGIDKGKPVNVKYTIPISFK